MTLRIATLNIRHDGSMSADALAARLLGNDADLLVVTEFRANDTGTRLIAQLDRAGYETSHPTADPKRNTVLIASRTPIDRASSFTRDLSDHHLWCVEFDGTIVAGVYLPQAHAKLPYWEGLIDRADAAASTCSSATSTRVTTISTKIPGARSASGRRSPDA